MARKKIISEPINFSFGFKIIKKTSLRKIMMVNDITRKAFYNLELLEDNTNILDSYKVIANFGKLGTIGTRKIIAKGNKGHCILLMAERYEQKLKKGYKIQV